MLANTCIASERRHLNIDDIIVKIKATGDAEKYLRRHVCMHDFHTREIHNNEARGWAAFGKFRHELCNLEILGRPSIAPFRCRRVASNS